MFDIARRPSFWKVAPPAALLLTLLACAGAARGTAPPIAAHDPAQTDGDKYRVVFENARVRVLRYHDEPLAKTHPHSHPCFLLYAIAPFERRLTFPDGSQKTRRFAAGEVAWMPAQSHVGENIGPAPTDALLIELKGPCS